MCSGLLKNLEQNKLLLNLENFTSHCLKNPEIWLVLLIGPLLIRPYCVYSFTNSKSQRASFKIDINQLFQKLSPASDCRATSSHFLFPQDLCEQQQRQKTEQRTTLTAACLPPPCRRRRCRLRCCP